MSVPTYTLTCRSTHTAEKFLDAARHRFGYLHATTDGPVITITWGGPFEFIADLGELARYLDDASDAAVTDLYMQYDREHP